MRPSTTSSSRNNTRYEDPEIETGRNYEPSKIWQPNDNKMIRSNDADQSRVRTKLRVYDKWLAAGQAMITSILICKSLNLSYRWLQGQLDMYTFSCTNQRITVSKTLKITKSRQ